MKLLCRQPPYRLAPAPIPSVSSPGVEPGPRPSQGRVRSATLREHSFQYPAEESNLVRQFRGLPCDPAHPQGLLSKCLDQDLNLDLDLRRVLCGPLHHRDVFKQHPDLESNQVQGFRKALCDPLHHRDKLPGPTTGFAPVWSSLQNCCLAIRPHRQLKQECKDLNPVGRLWRPLPLPGGHSCIGPGLATGAFGVTTTLSASRSSTLR